MRRKILVSSILAALLSTTALADNSSLQTSGMGLLENEWVKAGVNTNTGTLGSGGSTSPGLLFDPDGTGTFNAGYDYLTPGSPFDGFSVKVDGTNYANNNTGGTGITKDTDGFADGTDTLTWSGGVAGKFNIDNEYKLEDSKPFIDITTRIEMLTDAGEVNFAKYIDPDSQGMPGDSSSTDNVLGYGVIPDTNVAFSEATESKYALGIYTTDTNVTAGVEGWTQEADGYEGTNYTNDDGDPVNYGNSDDTIGISWTWTGVTSGDILTASYAYIFGPSAFDAAEDAITGGAGGGDTTTTDGWGTLTDVGTATDAAESGGTPEPVITTETVVDDSRPVLEASITTHDSSVANGVQTIDRETTTTTTTPMKTVTYTDGVETSSVVADSVITSVVTDPGSFTGRMDAAHQLIGLNMGRQLTIQDGIRGGRTSHTMDNGYSAETTHIGLGHTAIADNGILVSGGFNRANTTLSGDSAGDMETNHFGLRVGRALDDRDMTVGLAANVATSDINYTRTIGDFSAAGSTTHTDVSGMIKVEKSSGPIRPWAGYTIGRASTDAWTETGNIQATLHHAKSDSDYRFATIGLNAEAGIFDVSVSRAFDDEETMRLGVGVDRDINERVNVGLTMNRTKAGDNESTFLSAGVKIRF